MKNLIYPLIPIHRAADGEGVPFEYDPVLTGIVIGVQNQMLIYPEVMPYVPVEAQNFKYRVYNFKEKTTLTDDKVGRKTPPNMVEFPSTLEDGSTEDWGLRDVVPMTDINLGNKIGVDAKAEAAEGTMEIVLLNNEVRCANTVLSAANYTNSIDLTAGTNKQLDETGALPIDIITDFLDAMYARANVMVLGRREFTKLCRLPDIAKFINRSSGDKGKVTAGDIASIFDLDKVIVGQAFVNTAKKGQTASYTRAWTRDIALLHIETPNTARSQRPNWGITARFGDRVAYSYYDPKPGLNGAYEIKVGESNKALVTGKDFGYLIQKPFEK